MGTIFAELGDKNTAKKMFEQAIDLTPDGIEYNDPKIALEELQKSVLKKAFNGEL